MIPCAADLQAPSHTCMGHSPHITGLSFTFNNAWLVTVGGDDSAVFKWRVGAAEDDSQVDSSSKVVWCVTVRMVAIVWSVVTVKAVTRMCCIAMREPKLDWMACMRLVQTVRLCSFCAVHGSVSGPSGGASSGFFTPALAPSRRRQPGGTSPTFHQVWLLPLSGWMFLCAVSRRRESVSPPPPPPPDDLGRGHAS